jgi:hypothetical protein
MVGLGVDNSGTLTIHTISYYLIRVDPFSNYSTNNDGVNWEAYGSKI